MNLVVNQSWCKQRSGCVLLPPKYTFRMLKNEAGLQSDITALSPATEEQLCYLCNMPRHAGASLNMPERTARTRGCHSAPLQIIKSSMLLKMALATTVNSVCVYSMYYACVRVCVRANVYMHAFVCMRTLQGWSPLKVVIFS